MLAMLWNNRTKIMGGIMVVIGSLQASPMPDMLSEFGFKIFTIAVGVIVALIGFANSHAENKQP